MEPIKVKDIEDIEQAKKIIEDLQVRLFQGEMILDDLVRAVEIAEITKQFQLVSSFREAAEMFLKDRIVQPEQTQGEDFKVTIYQ